MSFTFRPATRENARLLIGLCGPSGGGKTLSALRLATGLAGGGEIVVIDTERGRAAQYAAPPGGPPNPPESYAFLVGALEPPFTPARYREALEAAYARGPAVVIIDSMSHEWEGPGGILEMVDRIKAERKVNDFAAWAKPKQEHQKLVNTLLQAPCHLVLCMRAKEKRTLVRDTHGRTEVVDAGWAPICEPNLTYELTVNMLLGPVGKGVPTFDFDHGKLPANMKGLFREGERITEALGERLAAWCRGCAGPGDVEEGARQPAAEPAAAPKRRPLVVYTASGQPASSVMRAADWLEAYRAELARTPAELRDAFMGKNLGTLRDLAARAERKAPPELREAFARELAAAEAALRDAEDAA